MTATEPEEPKPCPWCEQVGDAEDTEGGDWFVSCLNRRCDVRPASELFATRAEAIARWNRRSEK